MTGGRDVVVGRQGIYDVDGLVGYELLFRSVAPPGDNRADGSGASGDEMTAGVMFGAINIGVDALVGDGMLFCNADRGVITGETPIVLPPDRTVVEVLETLRIDDEVIAGVTRLVDAGYRIALDDFTWGSGHERLLPLASIVKIDLLLTPAAELAEVVEKCRPYGVRMLAEKIEDPADVPALRELGFVYFQGYAFERPSVVSGKALAGNELAGVKVAVDTLREDADIDQLEQVLRRDPALAHQIMRLASVGRRGETSRQFGSLRDALVIAGTENVRRWMALLLACPKDKGAGGGGDLAAVLLRARACELLAHARHVPRSDLAFTAGLLNGLEEVLDVPAEQLAAQLSLSADLHDAAFGGTTALGALVQDVAEYRYRVGGAQGRAGHRLPDTAWRSGVPLDDFDRVFAAAFSWALDCTEAIGTAVG